ncbi:MAG: hypothetical protein AAGH99_14360 [Planctomycetota bacterium]
MSIRSEDIPDAEEMDAVREAATPVKRRRGGIYRLARWTVRLGVAGVLLVLLVVALLPTLVSTGAGKARIVAAVNDTLPGRVEVDGLNLGWVSGQSLEGVRLYDPEGGVVGSVDRVRLEDVGLIGLLRGTRDMGIVAVEGIKLDLVEDELGRTNLDRALGTSFYVADKSEPSAGSESPENQPEEEASDEARKPASRPSASPGSGGNRALLPADLKLAFAMRVVELSAVGPTLPDVRVEIPEATVTADGPAKLGLTLDATVRQGADSGAISLAGTVTDLFDSTGRWSLGEAKFDVEGLVEHVPMAAFDRLVADVPSLEKLIGPMLDAQISLQGPASSLDALVTATSEHLNVRQGLIANAERLRASDESRSTWTVTPTAWEELTRSRSDTDDEEAEAGVALAEPFTLTFGLTGLDAPRQGQGVDLSRTQFVASVGLDEGQAIRLRVPDEGDLVIDQLAAAVGSAAADKGVAFTLDADVDAYGKRGELSGVVDVRRGEAGWGQLEIESVLRSLPMPVIDALTGQGERLTTTFGPSVGVSLLAKSDGEGGYALTAGFDPGAGSPGVSRLRGTMTGRYAADGAVALHTDEPIRLTLTPEAFAQWMVPVAMAAEMGESVGLSLPRAADVVADLDFEFALAEAPGGVPGAGGLRFDPERTRAVALVELPDTELVDEWYHRGFPLREGRLKIDAPDPREPITANLSFETEAADGQVGTLNAEARLTGVMLDDGYIQVERGQLSGEIDLDRVPTVVFDALSRQQGYAVAAFGETVSVDMSLSDWSFGGGGRVEFDLNSANNSLASFSGEDRDGYFVPDAPVTLFLNQTPELSNRILRFLNPILLPAVVSATVPMAVTIDDDTFRLPTRDFDLSKVNADVRVQMGTISIVPTVSPVDKILPQLQAVGLVDRASLYEARVSPIALAIRDGVFGYEELSFRIDDVELAFGGTISLIDQTVDMGMTIGGREIERDPLLKRLVGEGIRIGGTVKKPQVNLASVFDAFSQERLPQTLGGILEGVLRKELGRDEPESPPVTPVDDENTEEEPASEEPEREESLEETIGGLLGDFLRRELEKAQE